MPSTDSFLKISIAMSPTSSSAPATTPAPLTVAMLTHPGQAARIWKEAVQADRPVAIFLNGAYVGTT